MNITETQKSWIIIGAVVLASCLASAAKAETYILAGVGQGKAQLAYGTAAGDVAWQQKGFPHSESLKTTTFHLGMGYQFKPWLSGEATYHDLGRVSQKGEWLYHDDGTINSSCPCYGEGSAPVKGWTLAGIVRYPIGNFSVGLEAGMFKWQSSWRETIHDKNGISYHDPVKTSGVGALTGVVIGYKSFDLRYETFHVEPRDGIFDRMNVLRASYRLYFK
ncbi:MAG: hypothetical protein NUV74_05540 [Candidatus Brocadiaceae bacterium]|nr:hypothetical protein [Candidatus Brocadiaceae bacterium]